MGHVIVGIDVGTSKVCTLIGELEDGGVRIVGVGIVPARGLSKGAVINVAESTAAIAASVEQAEHSSGYEIARAFIGLSGTHLSSLNSRGVVGIARRDQGIELEDVERVLDAARAIAVPHNQEVLHVIPRSYIVDGQAGVRDPLGMHGFRLEVEAHIVTGASTAIQNLVKCVEGAQVEVDELVLNSIAAGDAVLTDAEREMGVVLVDIGEGTTDIAIFINGAIWHTITLGVGGEYFTNDVAYGLRLQPPVARQVKEQYGHARQAGVAPEERFTISASANGGGSPLVVPRWRLAEILEARAEELFTMVLQEIKRSGYDGLLSAGLVVCGGTAMMPGFADLGREVLGGLPVRIGVPRNLSGLVDRVGNPACAAAVGLLQWGLAADTRPQLRPSRPSALKKVGEWFRTLLPG